MLTNQSRIIGYRIAMYCLDKGIEPSLSWDDLLAAGDEIATYKQVLAWEGPNNSLLRNLDISFRKIYPFASLSGVWRNDIVMAFYRFLDIVKIHQNLDKCPIAPYDIGLSHRLWDAMKEGNFVFSEVRYMALKLAMECSAWTDAMYIYTRILKAAGDSYDNGNLRGDWIPLVPMEEYLNGFSDKTLDRFEKLHERNKLRAASLDSVVPTKTGEAMKNRNKIMLDKEDR